MNRPFHNDKKESQRDGYKKLETLIMNAFRNTNMNASIDNTSGNGLITAT